MDFGFEAAGFETAVAVELDHDCCESLRQSRSSPVIEGDIFKTPTEEILETAKLHCGEAFLVIGGPPCQPFSKSGYWANGDSARLKDPRAQTLDAYLRVIEEALPRAFVLENVGGLAYSKKDEGLTLLLSRIAQINRRTKSNYKPVFRVLQAAGYGVPQLRERLFLVAEREGKEFRFPSADFGEAKAQPKLELETPLQPFRTAWDAIGDLDDGSDDLAVQGKWADLLPSIPEGANYLWHTDRGGGMPLFGWRRRYWSFLLKIAKDRPSWTVQAQPGPATGPFHWSNRRLSIRELCRIQTFPEDVRIFGARGSAQRQVGNAVPSLLAEVIGRSIMQQLFGVAPKGTKPRLLPPLRLPIPPPEPVKRVPKKFHALRGEHEAHPGTGKGFGATARGRSALTNEGALT
jgi:DNA (cytosine-5)-methyltransferase 1